MDEMYRGEEKVNPSANITGRRQWINEEMNAFVPVSWFAIQKLILFKRAAPYEASRSIAMNQVHILDVDILVLRELTKIIDEMPLMYDIAGGINACHGCSGRARMNGG